MPREDSSPLRVLIVEDELLIRWSLAEALNDRHATVTEAATAREATAALTAPGSPPDVVVLDLRLPDSSDLSLLAWVRLTAPKARVIVMTAFGTPETVDEALRLGAQSVIAKPFDLTTMADIIVGRVRAAT